MKALLKAEATVLQQQSASKAGSTVAPALVCEVINEARGWDVMINSIRGSLCCPKDDWGHEVANKDETLYVNVQDVHPLITKKDKCCCWKLTWGCWEYKSIKNQYTTIFRLHILR